jgi:hypothetical protein
LAGTWYGRLFIGAYYTISPTLVKLFGNKHWFRNICRKKLDTMVDSLQKRGVESAPYDDVAW